MPYLSRIPINPRRTGSQRLLTNPQAAHAAVLAGLPSQPADERTLWRLDAAGIHRSDLIVLTQTRPDWHHIAEQAGWPDAPAAEPQIRDYQPLLSRLASGQRYAFRLRANTVSSSRRPVAPSASQQARRAAGGSRGSLVPQRTAAHQQQWFLDRASRWGFEVPQGLAGGPNMMLVDRSRMVFRKSPGARVTLVTATFEGLLDVTDAVQLAATLTTGAGRARAYGCGLLTLAPVQV